MLQSNFKTPAIQRDEYDVMPEDVYQVIIEDVNLEERQVYQSQDVEEVLNFKFTVLEEGEFKGRKVWKKIRPTLNAGWDGGSPSDLYELWKSAMKTLPTKEQLEVGLSGNDVNKLIGQQIRVTLKIKTTQKGKEYNKIEGFMAVRTELAAPKLKPKEAGEVRKLNTQQTTEVENTSEIDISDEGYTDMDEIERVNAEIAGTPKGGQNFPFE